MQQTESQAANERLAATTKLNKSLQGRYKVGDTVRVLTRSSEYFLVEGRVAEVSRFKDSGVVRFSKEVLEGADRPERLLGSRSNLHFYWRELQEVIYG